MTEATTEATVDLADDLLKGVRRIGLFLNEPDRRIRYMAEQNQLPVFKIGRCMYGRKSTLTKHIEKLEAEAMSGAGAA